LPEPLKNRFFGPKYVLDLSDALASVGYPIDKEKLLATVYDNSWAERELKDRMRHLTVSIKAMMPENYSSSTDLLRNIAPLMANYSFENMIFPDFVEQYGLHDWETSLPALEQFTQLASAEFAVRPFIVLDQGRMMSQMLKWAQHETSSVRRLATEGCRPRLPWAIALEAFKLDPGPILPILEILKMDESESVRRSVANNLNDISKDNPEITLKLASEWQKYEDQHIRWIIGHGLRSLVKEGNTQALSVLGYPSELEIKVGKLVVEPREVLMGEELEFTFSVQSMASGVQNLMVDYALYFVRANGKTNKKVFKLSRKRLRPNETISIRKKHSFRPISTRKYYPGKHKIEIQINGKIYAQAVIILKK